MDVEIFEKVHLGPEIWLFENELPKSVTFAPILGPNLRLPSLNGHSSAPRGSNDADPFSSARVLPDADFGHWKWPKRPF